MLNNLKLFNMKERVNFTSQGLGNIEIWDDLINNFQIIEESIEWDRLLRSSFQKRVLYWTTQNCFPNYSYKCNHFEIWYKINEDGSLRITDIKF
jgi:hypothetical protein